MARYSGSGWHRQSIRHSNARKYGKAGGTYANMSIPELRGRLETNNHLAYMNQSINKEFALKKLHENQEIALEIQKRIEEGRHYGEAEKGETAGQVLERLSKSESSSEMDSKIMQALLRQTGLYPNAVVVYGIVYLDGKGTIQNPPTSIHAVAKQILKAVEQAKKGKNYGQPEWKPVSKEQEINERISSLKLMLIKKAQTKGIYENFGQKEVRKLQDIFGYTPEIEEFDKWAMNFDQIKLQKTIEAQEKGLPLKEIEKQRNYGKAERKPIGIHFDSAFSGTEIVDVDVNGEWVKTRDFYPQNDKTIKGRVVKRKMNIDEEGVATFNIDKEKYALNDFMRTGDN